MATAGVAFARMDYIGRQPEVRRARHHMEPAAGEMGTDQPPREKA
jgi:hypothetical protein